jgi:hypothetical protein
MESDGSCPEYPKVRAYGVMNSGRYNSPPLEFNLVLELAKWLLQVYLRTSLIISLYFLLELQTLEELHFVNPDGWSGNLCRFSGVS